MSRAVNVCIVSLLCLVLNVRSRDGDTTLSLFGSLIDILESNSFAGAQSLVQSLCDSSCQSCFTMVNVADGTNVTMGLGSFKSSFSHFLVILLKSVI